MFNLKKFIAGFIMGSLIFCSVPAFVDSVQSIFGAKVTGVYAVQKSSGEKIAEGAILNGSTYVPVRAISEAVGTPLTVDTKEKVIILEDTKTTTSTTITETEAIPESLKDKLEEDLQAAESRLNVLTKN